MVQMSNPLEGWSRCKSWGLHTEVFQSLFLHIPPLIQCAKSHHLALEDNVITTHGSPLFINDAGNAPLDSPQRPPDSRGVVQK